MAIGQIRELPRHRVLGPHNHPKLPDTVIQHSYEQLSIYRLFTTYEHCDFPYVAVGMSFRPWAAAQKLGGRDSLGDFVDPAVAGFSFVALGPSWNYFVINMYIYIYKNYIIYIIIIIYIYILFIYP